MILLATGGRRLPVFHSPGFFPLYIVTTDKDARTLFQERSNSLWYGLERFLDLPFTDFAADIVVLDVSSFSAALLGGVVTEAVRILAPKGVLFILGAADFEISTFSPQAAKLVLPGSYVHSYVRRLEVVPDLPVCEACGMRSMFGQKSIELSPQNQCQAWIQKDFKSIFQPDMLDKFNRKSKESLENQRLKLWWRRNVLKTQKVAGKGEWTDRYARTNTASYNAAYVNSDPFKLPKHLEKKVKAGQVKRILDAGAGTCSLEGELRRKGYWKLIHNFLAFGSYDCSMLRICAERGSICFQHNWLTPLPVCASCKFDLIYQWAGVHHNTGIDRQTKFIDNMLAVLECNGLLFINDIGEWRPDMRKILKVKREQKIARLHENKDGAFEITRTC